ncbi:MAG: ATP-binding cassette domain-containing protein [Peptococcaceae bacterium]|nr:ATP-binding cassette domain-containing protein [Peptococcaceae bacterium]
MPVDELQGIDIEYRLLHNIHFSLKRGEVLALMGPNGSGKSTLARIIAGLTLPASGEVIPLDHGKKLSWQNIERWQTIGFIGQHPRRQTIGATVAEELGFGLLNQGHKVSEVRLRVQQLAHEIGLEKQLNQSPSSLSGGERQRLVFAAVLALKPSFLILDESLTMLDSRSQERCLRLLNTRAADMGQIWITHDPELAVKADRLLIMRDGRMQDLGEPSGVLNNTRVCREYSIRSLFPDSTFDENGKKPDTKKKKITQKNILEWEKTQYSSRLEISQKVKAFEFIGIVGPSGSGKSTLLESAAALIKPDTGTYYAFGQEITKTKNDLRQKVRLLLQEPGEYQIGRNAYHEVFYLQSRRIKKERFNENMEYLKAFGIPENLANRPLENLSGGERQKAAIAAALESLPEVLLLDEPLIGLDLNGRLYIQSFLREMKGKISILYVTHDLSEITDIADRLWLIENGRLKLDCLMEDWFKHREQLQRAGIHCPKANQQPEQENITN